MPRFVYVLNKIGYALPFLVGVLLVLSKFSENANRLPWEQLGQAILFSLAVSAFSLLVFWLIPITRRAAAIVSSVFVIVTMLWMTFPYVPLPHMGSLPLIPVGFMLVVIVLFYRMKRKNIQSATAWAMLIVGMSCFVALGMAGIASSRPVQGAAITSDVALNKTPDIYFIVPDRFCSQKGLLEMGLDDSDFMAYLESKGFYVQPDKTSLDAMPPDGKETGTTRTCRFMASVLNLGKEVPLSIPYNVASQMIKYNEFAEILKANNYTYYHIGDWWTETETNPLADVNYMYQSATLEPSEELSMALVDRSIWRYVTTYLWQSQDVYRARHDFQQESLIETTTLPGPKFVMAHILIPHPPFLFKADGSPQDSNVPVWDAYLEQVEYTEAWLTTVIDEIPDDAIVILQSDEGVAFTKRQANYDLTHDEWEGVLCAWRVPGNLDDIEITQILGYVIEQLKGE
jgi:hypothetical protein